MSTLLETRVIDSTKRALLKYDFLGDGTQMANVTLIDVSTLAYAKNANSFIMTANADPKASYRVAVRRATITGRVNGSIQLNWANSAPLLYMSSFDNVNFDAAGDAATLPNPNTATPGDILVTTNGSTANDAWSLIIDLRKDGRDYDQGVTADPYAFNNSRDGRYVR